MNGLRWFVFAPVALFSLIAPTQVRATNEQGLTTITEPTDFLFTYSEPTQFLAVTFQSDGFPSGTIPFWNGSSTGTATSFTGTFNTKDSGQLDFNGGVGSAGQAVVLYTTGGSQYVDFSAEL